MDTILFIVPNHAMGHVVEALALANKLNNEYNIVFLAENKTDKIIQEQGFNCISFPARDFCSSQSQIFFDGYIEDCVLAIIPAIKPDLIISCHPCFIFSFKELKKLFPHIHVCLYGQFSPKMLKYLSNICDHVFCTVPEIFKYSNLKKVSFIGPILNDYQLSKNRIQKISHLIESPYILVALGGGGHKEETNQMAIVINIVAKIFCDINFIVTGFLEMIPFDAKNINFLGLITPQEMVYLENNCSFAIARAGKTIVEIVSNKKPVIALVLPNEKEQLQRSKILSDHGVCDYIEYEILSVESLYKSIRNMKRKREAFLNCINALNLENQANTLANRIKEILPPENNRLIFSNVNSKVYPFSSGEILISQNKNQITIDARTKLDYKNATQKENATPEVNPSMVLPNWLLDHSPYNLKKLLGFNPNDRDPYHHTLIINTSNKNNKSIQFSGIINSRPFKSEYEISSEIERIKIVINLGNIH